MSQARTEFDFNNCDGWKLRRSKQVWFHFIDQYIAVIEKYGT